MGCIQFVGLATIQYIEFVFRHMKKSRKERGREFRDRINQKFGLKTGDSDSDDGSGDDRSRNIGKA